MMPLIIGFAVILVIALIIYVWKMRSSESGTQQPTAQQPVQQQPLPLIPSITPLPPMPSMIPPEPIQQPVQQPVSQPVQQPTIALAPPAPTPIYTKPAEQPVAAPPAISVLPYTPPVIYTSQPTAPTAPAAPAYDPAVLTKYIKVSKSSTTYKNDDDSFQLAELVIKSEDGQISAADIQSVTSSASAYGSNPKMIVDGNTNGSYFAMTSWHSDNVSQPRWIMVTLAKPMKISSVKVFNRTDCCWERLSGASLELINQYNKVINSVSLSGSLVQDYSF